MLMVIGTCIGLMVGILVTLYILRRDTIGNLVIADDADEGSYMFLEISQTDIERLRIQSIIKLRVVDKGKVPHK